VASSPDEIAEEILDFFRRNPGTADTFEGIVRWRLMQQTIHKTVTETKAAIALLVKRGLLEEMQTPSGRIYRLRPGAPNSTLSGAEGEE
jgi:hypothetical protein